MQQSFIPLPLGAELACFRTSAQRLVTTPGRKCALSRSGTAAQKNLTNYGDPILWNTTFQYHLWQYFWPELEVNYMYWPNGQHQGLSQVLLTPGIIFGRFKIGMDSPTRPINLILGAGYQVSVTGDPVVKNNWVATVRISFSAAHCTRRRRSDPALSLSPRSPGDVGVAATPRTACRIADSLARMGQRE
jgi:hypothetical protein